MNARRIAALALAVPVAASLAFAAPTGPQQVSHSGRVEADVDVEIFNVSGTVRVSGWDRNEVDVRGTLGEGVDRLDFENDEDDVEIRVVVPRSRRRDPQRRVGDSDLEIRVPRGASVTVEALAASITVTDVDGDVSMETSAGSVTYSGASPDVEAGAAAGDIEVTTTATGASIDIEGVAGAVLVQFTDATVDAVTLTGDLRLIGGRLRGGDFESVSGSIYLEGEIARGARVDFENFNGDIEMLIPEDSAARFELSSYSGSIATEFGFEGRRADIYSPEQEAEFTLGDGGGDARVSAETFSGTIRVNRR